MTYTTANIPEKYIYYICTDNKLIPIYTQKKHLKKEIEFIKNKFNLKHVINNNIVSFKNIRYFILNEITVFNKYFNDWIIIEPIPKRYVLNFKNNYASYSILTDLKKYNIYDFNYKQIGNYSIGTHINIEYSFYPQYIQISWKNFFKDDYKTINLDDNIINGYSKFLEIIDTYKTQYGTDIVKQVI